MSRSDYPALHRKQPANQHKTLISHCYFYVKNKTKTEMEFLQQQYQCSRTDSVSLHTDRTAPRSRMFLFYFILKNYEINVMYVNTHILMV